MKREVLDAGGAAQTESAVMRGRIAYASNGRLHVLDLATGTLELLDPGAPAWDPAWTADGRRLVHSPGISVLDREALKVQVYDLPGARWPAFSPDGGWVAFGRPGTGLLLLDVERHEVIELLDNRMMPFQPAFSPDGHKLAFVGTVGRLPDGSDERAINMIDLACLERDDCAAAVSQLTSGQRFDHAPTWSPDGRSIAFERLAAGDQNWATMLLELDSGRIRRVSRPEYSEHHPTFGPDGRTLVVQRDASAAPPNLFLIDLDGNTLQQLTHDGGVRPDWGWPRQ